MRHRAYAICSETNQRHRIAIIKLNNRCYDRLLVILDTAYWNLRISTHHIYFELNIFRKAFVCSKLKQRITKNETATIKKRIFVQIQMKAQNDHVFFLYQNNPIELN